MPADQLRAVFGVLADPTRRAPQIIIVRRFDAPREPVFRAHIEPDPLASCLDPGHAAAPPRRDPIEHRKLRRNMMRELTVDLFTTVDGWAQGRNSPAYFGYLGPGLQAWIDEQLARPHVMLMGSNTYRALAEITASGGDPTFPVMAKLPKVVFSKSLQQPLTWANTTLVREDATVALPAMKNQPGDPLRVIGSLTLVRSLFRLGQVDRLRLMVFPQILGTTGQERILQNLPDINLRLVSTQVLDQRLVLLDYHVD
jgi:dihydrofolate reductase